VTTELREPRERVSPRARSMWLVGCLLEGLVTVAILVGTALAWESLPARWWLVGGAGVLTVGYAVVVPRWRYLVHRWEVSASAVYTQTGWWARERRIAPMSRIQTVDYAEGALSRLFGLATVTVTTASAAGALRIEGLDKRLAQRLVDELTVQADAVEGDAT
jgi:uncharacterized protein